MKDFFQAIKHKVNGMIWTMGSTGIILLILGILIVWTDFMLRLTLGLFVLVIGYTFLYLTYKLWHVKKEIERHFKLWHAN